MSTLQDIDLPCIQSNKKLICIQFIGKYPTAIMTSVTTKSCEDFLPQPVATIHFLLVFIHLGRRGVVHALHGYGNNFANIFFCDKIFKLQKFWSNTVDGSFTL